MATAIIMPKQGQSVESCIINEWKVQAGDSISEGDIICEVETDKAVLEVESTASGTILGLFFEEGDEVAVLANIAVIGEPGENIDAYRPDSATAEMPVDAQESADGSTATAAPPVDSTRPLPAETPAAAPTGISPRAKKLAQRKQIDLAALQGSGPGGRIIERDVAAAVAAQPGLTPLAQAMASTGQFSVPEQGSGVSGRIMAGDLTPVAEAAAPIPAAQADADEVETIPVKGVRKVIAERMWASLQETAQLTLNASADATAILSYRKRLKASDEALGLQKITINDLILFAVARTLPDYPEVNALFADNTITRYKNVHLAVAVDTPRGLVVPVMRNAQNLSLKQISEQAKRLAAGAMDGSVSPDELTGGTFTVTNLGSLGIESFTPILNPPQVGILGVSTITLKPVEVEGEVKFVHHLGLSLTINHQVVDGAPAARFLQSLAQAIANIELMLAV